MMQENLAVTNQSWKKMQIHRVLHHKMHVGGGASSGRPDQLLLWEQSDLGLHCLPSHIYPKVLCVFVCGNKGSLIVFPCYSVIYLILVSDYLNKILVDDF